MNTSFKKIIAGVTAVTVIAMNGAVVNAAVIGTGSITGSGASASPINWNGTFTANSASGSVTGIAVSASVSPVLTMDISTGSLSLGVLSATTATASLNIEVGTNATNGLVITAQSTNGGLRSATATGIINSTATDGVAESYRFHSLLGTQDSTLADFVPTAALNADITTSGANTIYSTNRPEPIEGTNPDVTFSVTSSVAYQTPAASDYSDTVTFSVTGNF